MALSVSFDLTTADKGRWQTLIRDGRWHSLVISGKTQHAIPPGDGFIQVDLFGSKGRGEAVIWLRFQRYPQLDSTAWACFAQRGRAGWAIHHDEHMTFHPGETYGVDYRIERGAPVVKLKNRVLRGNV